MAIEIAAGFDPYRAWLNVREVRRPLNAYQLLGLRPLEEEQEKIRAAARRQRAAIEARRHDAPPEVWQQVRSELEEAVRILLDEDQKAAYDLTLQEQGGNGEPVRSSGLGGAIGAMPMDGHGALLHCHFCGATNPAVRKYCANCGKHLWEACIVCGTLSASGEKYCGACGANMANAVKQQIEQFNNDIERALQLQADCQFDEAISLLGTVSKADHGQLKDHAERARELIKEIAAERDRKQSVAAEGLEQARARLAAHDWEGAIEVIEAVPPGMRDADIESLLEQARTQRDEIGVLSREVGQAIAEKRITASLLPQVARLLELNPNHKQAQLLAQRLRDHMCQVTKQRLARYQYDEALKLLEQIPESVWTNECGSLREFAEEMIWLRRDFQTAPVADKTLLEVAERIRRHAPKDPKIDKMYQELKRRLEAAEGESRITPPRWAAPPKASLLGAPLLWKSSFRQIDASEVAQLPAIAAHPGCYYVACGLALQLLGRADLDTNLFPQDSRGVLGRMGRIMGKRTARTAWGLDLSSSGLKAVQLALEGEEERVVVKAVDHIEHKKLLSQAVNENEEETLIRETLETFLARNEVKGERAAIGLPGLMVLCREVSLPPMSAKQIGGVMQYEVRQQVPFELEGVVWDYQLLGDENIQDIGGDELRVLLLAAKRPQVEPRVKRFRDAGISVDLVQSDCLALHNLLQFENQDADPGSASNAARVVLDMGSDTTNILVSSDDSVWFRSVGLGGHTFTKALVREFNLTVVQAEELKRNPAKARRISRLYEIWEPIFDDLIKEIQTATQSYRQVYENRSIERIVAVGGGLQLHGLLRYLRVGK
jgi:type IV pilus assembly protein PilM